MTYEINKPRTVAKVSAVSDDRTTIYLALRNGLTATLTNIDPIDLDVGDVILVNQEDGSFEFVPDELWHEESWIGVIRLLTEDAVVVDISGKLRKLAKPEHVDLAEGNTVEGTDDGGIQQILSEKPIRFLDLPIHEELSADKFKIAPSKSPSFEDFGGFAEIVGRARELIELPLEHHDDLQKIGAKPIKGVLFTGPPGTGKTMLARIIANQAGAQFHEISGPEVMSKWYGQSEELVRAIFEDARKQPRAIIFFDELDSIAVQRNDESHEASRRVVGQLLSSIDGFDESTNVVVVATTNRPQDIDVALRRPGRLDWEIHFPLPAKEDREAILRTSARGLGTHGDLPHALVAQRTESWSAAELTAIWSEAALLAVRDGRDAIMEEDYLGGYDRVDAQRQLVAATSKGEAKDRKDA